MGTEPTYLYKLIPGSCLELLPIPLPRKLPVSELDRKDGFVHLSTAAQVPGTIQRFFANGRLVKVLRLEYASVKEFIKWEDPDGNLGEIGADNVFPHMYRQQGLGKEDVMEIFEIQREGTGGWNVDFLRGHPGLIY